MDKKIISILSVAVSLITLAIIAGVYFRIFKENKTESIKKEEQNVVAGKIDKNQIKDLNSTVNNNLNKEDVLNLLPDELALFEVRENGFSGDQSFYSVNVFISLNTESKLKRAGLARNDWNQYTGCWIVNLHNNTAYRIATAQQHQDYIFNQWVGNDKIELVGDGKLTATIYNALTGDMVSKRKFNLNTGADVSNWKVYKSEEYGFEVKYPENFVIKEVKENYAENLENRYVSFYDSKNDIKIFLGVKNISEENVDPRPFRTGVGSEESLSRGTVAFGDGFANEKWLVSFGEGNISYVEEIWFCKDDNTADLSCNNIKLNNQKEAFMGVKVGAKAEIRETQELLGGMIRTFKTL